jgi:smad nuclear-interacting protein 1
MIFRPFIIDLESTNGTHVNGETIPVARYYELKLNDGRGTFVLVPKYESDLCLPVIKFGTSNREFVLLHEDVAP